MGKKCSENSKPPHQGLSPETKTEGRFGPKPVCIELDAQRGCQRTLEHKPWVGVTAGTCAVGGCAMGKVPLFPFWASSYIPPAFTSPH